MSAARDLQDLLDQVSEAKGWRSVRVEDGWRVYPADAAERVIYVTRHATDPVVGRFRQHLRRANFPFRNGNSLPPSRPVKELPMSPPTVPAASQSTTTIEKSLPEQAADCINRIMGELSMLEAITKKMDAQSEEFRKFKASLAALQAMA